MKNLLIYQSTEYDCGPTTLTNAIRYLFDREEIYPDIVKYIMLYCLDSYNEAGEVGKRGTSASAMMFLSNWLTQFGQVKNFPISCNFLAKTGISGSDIYVFDPYYEEPDDPELDKEFFEEGITFITDQPKRANRLISITRVSCTGVGFYEMGPYEEREAVILFNTNTRKTPENSIEYII